LSVKNVPSICISDPKNGHSFISNVSIQTWRILFYELLKFKLGDIGHSELGKCEVRNFSPWLLYLNDLFKIEDL